MRRVTRPLPILAAVFAAALTACGGQGGIGPGIPGSSSAQSARMSGPLSMVRATQRIRELIKEGHGSAVPAHGGAGYPVTGASIDVDSDLPVGAGVSSSAALECSVVLALCELAGASVPDGAGHSFCR